MKLEEIYEVNKNDDVFIHLVNSSCLEDAFIDLIWEGWVFDLSEDYLNYEVVSIGRSLKDCENGINGYYLYIDIN